MDYDTAAIRHFITQYFDDNELNYFCADYFREVYEDFSSGISKRQKVHNLVEYCYRHGRLTDLLAALERERPALYPEHFFAQSAPRDEAPVVLAPIERDPRQVFISHAHEDADFAYRLTRDLQAHGWQVWITPDSIWPGEKWVEAINRGLEESGIFVLVLTPAAVNSRWVHSETNSAIEMEHKGIIRFVPLQLESCQVPPVWSTYQYISFLDKYRISLGALLAVLELKVYSETGSEVQILKPQSSQVSSDLTNSQATNENTAAVLVVNAEPEIRHLYRVILSTKGYIVSEAANVREAIVQADRNIPDLVITELRLPNISGYELCNYLRHEETTTHVPILVVSTQSDLYTIQKAKEAGATEFLTMPVKPDVLIQKVDKILQGRSG